MIKFTQQYCADAHQVLAEGLAPKLFYVDRTYQSIPMTSGLFGAPIMVVMEFISGSPSNELLGEAPISQHAHSRVKVAVKALHDRDIVFGDLRRPNIMVAHSKEVKMIDFDWCGKDGKATYPAILNDTLEMHWHPDVARGSVIRKEHDLFMLENLLPAALLPMIVEESDPNYRFRTGSTGVQLEPRSLVPPSHGGIQSPNGQVKQKYRMDKTKMHTLTHPTQRRSR